MIKTIDKITIGDFHKQELTGSITQYKSNFNILPSFLFRKGLENLAIQIDEYINNNELNKSVINNEWQATSINKINRLEVAYDIVYLNLITIIEIKLLLSKTKLTRKQKRKLKAPKNDLHKALEVINDIYGIKIKKGEEIEFIEKVRKEIIRRKDKHNENFKVNDTQGNNTEKRYIIDIVADYQCYFSQSTLGTQKMTIYEFKALRDKVISSIKKQQLEKK